MPRAATAPARALRVDDLPAKIAASLRDGGHANDFQYALKTALKPDATVPIVWAVLTSIALLLCTTHARRGIWRRYSFGEINAMQLIESHTTLRIISAGIDTPDLLLPLPEGTELAWVEDFMRIYGAVRGAS